MATSGGLQQATTTLQQKATYDYEPGRSGPPGAALQGRHHLQAAGLRPGGAILPERQGCVRKESAGGQTKTQREQLLPTTRYGRRLRGLLGDIPVHLGDYVSSTTTLTTGGRGNSGLEAYIYIPTERATQVRSGLAVDLLDESGTVLAHSNIYFVSPEVDNGLQGILAKAPIPKSAERLRVGQIVNARITWSTSKQPTVPVLAVTRIGGQSFVYVAAAKDSGFIAHQVSVTLGEPVGNLYPVLGGLKTGDRVILSGIKMLQEGAPVQPMQPPPGAAKAGGLSGLTFRGSSSRNQMQRTWYGYQG